MRLIIILLIGFVTFRVLDIYQTVYFIESCGLLEQNTMARWAFFHGGTVGIVLWSLIFTSLSIGIILTIYFKYQNTDQKKRAEIAATIASIIACVVTGYILAHWGEYGKENRLDTDTNVPLGLYGYISTNPQPLPQATLIDLVSRDESVLAVHGGHPNFFRYLKHENMNVTIVYEYDREYQDKPLVKKFVFQSK